MCHRASGLAKTKFQFALSIQFKIISWQHLSVIGKDHVVERPIEQTCRLWRAENSERCHNKTVWLAWTTHTVNLLLSH